MTGPRGRGADEREDVAELPATAASGNRSARPGPADPTEPPSAAAGDGRPTLTDQVGVGQVGSHPLQREAGRPAVEQPDLDEHAGSAERAGPAERHPGPTDGPEPRQPAPPRRTATDFACLIALVVVIIAVAETIGLRRITITSTVTLTLLPLVFAVALAMLAGVPAWRRGPLKRVFAPANVGFASKYLIIMMLPLMAYYGAQVAPKLREVLAIGWVFVAHELGNLGTVVLGLPIALALGLRRRAIGSTLGLGREGELAYISERYGLDSEPGRGVLSLYLIGTLFGALFFSFFAPLLLHLGYDVRALAIASGMGSASMMTAASSTLAAAEPAHADVVLSYAAASQLVTSFLGTYVMVFLAVPLQRALYNLFMRGKDRL